MRSAESYRSAKRMAKKAARRQQAARPVARPPILGTWAAQGGTLTAGERGAIEARARAATEEARRLTVADIDKAMEQALSAHQAAGRTDPLPLNRPFAARARALGWVENVEFIEEAKQHG